MSTDDLSYIGQLQAGKTAAFSLLSNGILVKIPFDASSLDEGSSSDPDSYLFRDASKPWGDQLPGTPVGVAVDKHGKPWVLVYERLSRNVFLMTSPEPDEHWDNRDWWKVSQPLHLQATKGELTGRPYGILAGFASVFVLTAGKLARFDIARAQWSIKTLKSPLPPLQMHNPITLVEKDRWMWVGTDAGEFGGDLVKADWKAGTAVVVDSRDTVTGLVDDPGHPGCVIFSSGLAHMTTRGAVYRTCGDTLDAIYKGKQPIWGLFRTEGGLYALLQGGIAPVNKDGLDFSKETKHPDPLNNALDGLPAYVMKNALVLYSKSRWQVSLSGPTPVVVPLPASAKIKLAPRKPPKPATADGLSRVFRTDELSH